MSYFRLIPQQSGQYIFRFVGTNHEQILASETYYTKQGCQNGIEAVKRLAPYDSNYRRSDLISNYRFNIVSGNNEIVARSSEGYTTRQNRENAIDLVKRDAPTAPVYEW